MPPCRHHVSVKLFVSCPKMLLPVHQSVLNLHCLEEMCSDVYQVVPGAGCRFTDDAECTCPGNGATCTAPRLAAV